MNFNALSHSHRMPKVNQRSGLRRHLKEYIPAALEDLYGRKPCQCRQRLGVIVPLPCGGE
jgi:hypothetical protein